MVTNNQQPQIQDILNQITRQNNKPKHQWGSNLANAAVSAASGNPVGVGMAMVRGANAVGKFFYDWRKEQEQRQLQQLMAMRNR